MSKKTIGLLVAAFVAIAAFVGYRSNHATVTTPLFDSRIHDLGSIRLRLPSGDFINTGRIDPGRSVRAKVPFVNAGTQTIDQSQFRQCESCSKSATLITAMGLVQPNHAGELEFAVTANARPGKSSAIAIVEYLSSEPYPESQSLPRLTVQLAYESTSHGLCEWAFSNFDLGSISVSRQAECEFHFVEQLYEAGPSKLDLSCGAPGVELTISAEKEGIGIYDVKAVTYTVRCVVNPASLGLGRQSAIVNATTPLGVRKMVLSWTAENDYRFLPNPCVLFQSAEQTRTHSLTLRNMLDESFTIEKVECDLNGVEIEYPSETSTQHQIVLRLETHQMEAHGQLRVSLRDASGRVREESLPCVVEQIAHRPTRATAE